MNTNTLPGRIILLTSLQRIVLRDALATYRLACRDETVRTARAAWRAESGVAPETDDYASDEMRAFVSQLDNALATGPSTEERIASVANEIEFSDAVKAFGVSREENPYAKAAWEAGDEGELEVDESTVVSRSIGGAYVLAWQFVSDEEAGCESSSALLEALAETLRKVLDTPVTRIRAGSELWDAARVKRLSASLAWLEETLGNFADEIDELINPGVSFGEVHFSHEGSTYVITPSTALAEMLNACEQAIEATGRGQRIRETVMRIGPLLDTSLIGFPIDELFLPAGNVVSSTVSA